MSICRRGSFFPVFVSLFALSFASIACASDADTKAKVSRDCSKCHSVRLLNTQKGLTENQWMATIDRMKSAGLVISEADQQEIAAYLSRTIK